MTQPEGGYLDPWKDNRLTTFFEHFPNLGHVMELSCLFGDHTIELARRAEKVTVVEGRQANILVAKERVKQAGLTNVEFILANMEDEVPDVGADVIFCSGLLYHLPKPWEFLARLKAPKLFLWTHFTTEPTDVLPEGYKGSWWNEHGIHDPHSGMSRFSFWFTQDSLIKALGEVGYIPDFISYSTGWLASGPNLMMVCSR